MLLTVLGVASVPAAHALTINVTCPAGTTTASYDPGIRLMTRTVRVRGEDIYGGPCISSDPTIAFGIDQFDATLPLSCEQPFFSGLGTTVIKWNNGRQSTLSVNGVVTTNGGQIIDTFTGTVTAGEFTGASVVAVLTDVQPDILECASSHGVTSESGTTTLIISTL
jgi:hypothetical protein